MRRHVGQVSFLSAVVSWLILIVSLMLGGLDPSSGIAQMLQLAGGITLLLAIVALASGLAAIFYGRQRIYGIIGCVLAMIFLLFFTGAFWLV